MSTEESESGNDLANVNVTVTGSGSGSVLFCAGQVFGSSLVPDVGLVSMSRDCWHSFYSLGT